MAVHQLPRALSLAAIATLAFVLAACGDDKGRPEPTVATTSTIVLATGPAATTADTSFIGSADSAACNSDERTIELAIEAFQAVNNRLPASIEELVTEGFLREASKNFEVDPNGAVVPLDTGRCG